MILGSPLSTPATLRRFPPYAQLAAHALAQLWVPHALCHAREHAFPLSPRMRPCRRRFHCPGSAHTSRLRVGGRPAVYQFAGSHPTGCACVQRGRRLRPSRFIDRGCSAPRAATVRARGRQPPLRRPPHRTPRGSMPQLLHRIRLRCGRRRYCSTGAEHHPDRNRSGTARGGP